MPRLSHAVPKYRKHRASGQAIVTLAGRDHYLGPHGTKSSKIEYDRLIGEWLAAGRPTSCPQEAQEITITELCAAYWRFARGYYVKGGEPTGQLAGIKVGLRYLRESYGHTSASEFGPLAIKALQQKMVQAGSSRRYINDNIDRIRRAFKWAASEELIPPTVPQSLATVPGLRKGRTEARETAPILPVAEGEVNATLACLPAVVADMVCLQRLTGMRPAEVCGLRPGDVDRQGPVWVVRPKSHKTSHHDRDRTIFVGPKGQEVLRPYLLRSAAAFCFSPAESEAKRRAEQHEARRTALSCGNRPGTNRSAAPKRCARDRYDTASYRRAIHRACDKAFPPPEPLAQWDGETAVQWQTRLSSQQREELAKWQSDHRWSPNQLRHAAGTEVRRQFGLEAAQVYLGHSTADVTQIYADRDLQLGMKVAVEVG